MRPVDIDVFAVLIHDLAYATREVDYYPESISAGMRLDSACKAWLQARREQRERAKEGR